jgi:hypothetical protein
VNYVFKSTKNRTMKNLIKLLLLFLFLNLSTNGFAQTVYVNKTDSKYHRLTCKYLDSSHDSLSMEFAIQKGLGACPVCNPSAKSGGSGTMGNMGTTKGMDAPKSTDPAKNMEKSGMGKQVNNVSGNNMSAQCAVIDKDGKRCPGKAEPGSVYCAEHKNYKK